MSVNEKKSRKKKLNPENEIVSKFFNKKQNNGEPATKKNKVEEDVNSDDSLRFFKKPPNLRNIAAASTSKDTSSPSTSKDNVVSEFINKPSTSKQTKKTTAAKPKRATKPKKPKSQTDIRKALNKKDEMIYNAINESCTQDGVDPFEMQLALAISESLKDVNKEKHPKDESSNETKTFDNPFNSSGKIQPISTVLERYGFKSKRVYSDYEIEMFFNNKSKKRTKYQKFPTLLTNTTDDKRDEMIRNRIHDILDSSLFAETQESEKAEIAKIEKKNPVVYYEDLMEMHELVNTAFRRSSESMVHSDYFVTELFEIAHNKPGYLLKDWSKIAGRDPSPVRESKRKSAEIVSDQNDLPAITENKEDELHVKIDEKSQQVKDDPKEILLSPNSSCSDIFEGIESFSMDQLGETESEASLKAVNEHLELLHEKLSQSVVMHQDNEKFSDKNKIPSVDLTQDESTNSENSDSTQEYIYDPTDSPKTAQKSLEQDKKLDQISCNNDVPQTSNNDDGEIFDLTQCDSKEEEIINYKNGEEAHSAAKSQQQEEEEIFDLTQCESYKAPNMDCKYTSQVIEPFDVHENISSNDLTQHGNENLKIEYEKSSELKENVSDENEIFDLTQCASPQSLSKSSTAHSFDENEIINISDDEINYSINRCQDNNSNEYPSNSFPSQQVDDVIEIDNLAEQSLIDMIAKDEKDVQIENSVSELLNNFSEYNKSFSHARKNRSIKFLETENLGDSIADIMKKYGVIPHNSPKAKSFSKIHSESNLERFSSQHSIEQVNADDDVDLTVINDFSSQNDSQEKEDSEKMDMSINKSLANILKSPLVKQSDRLSKEKPRKSLGLIMNDKYVVDTETLFTPPDFENMTPHELKLQLFKYGIRPLAVKKAVQLLTHIYNQMHPLIRIAIDEEIDMNDSRKDMNITDVVTDIGMKGDDDVYVFQLDQSGILEDEEYILPNVRKSKVPSCLIPLHISFYNMVRSNDKLQKYILEYRPVDLDQIYKHFRKFGLTYQTNDIIAFLDKRCITFKTKEQSCSKKHERKKQKRTQKS
ncbi:structure-specific endonuclease subunit SLX4 [Chironomus tepperi]|uniref:structure-specific endonuclease subunit SLX4 n=1 Tax=Chironomus tepperi TaxID=113505 RepID=UPI00391F2A5C